MFFDDGLFDYLAPTATAEYTLAGVHIPPDNPEPVVLELEYAGRGSPYWNAILKLKPLEDEIEATKRAAVVFAKHAIRGWKNVQKDGKPVPYTHELAGEVLVKLIHAKRYAKVEAAINFGMAPDNFKPPTVEAAELGKG